MRALNAPAPPFAKAKIVEVRVLFAVFVLLVRRRGLEPPQDCSHYHLKVARLPIPPPPHSLDNVKNSRSLMSFWDLTRCASTHNSPECNT